MAETALSSLRTVLYKELKLFFPKSFMEDDPSSNYMISSIKKEKYLSALEILYFSTNTAPYNCHSCTAYNSGSFQHAKNIVIEHERSKHFLKLSTQTA